MNWKSWSSAFNRPTIPGVTYRTYILKFRNLCEYITFEQSIVKNYKKPQTYWLTLVSLLGPTCSLIRLERIIYMRQTLHLLSLIRETTLQSLNLLIGNWDIILTNALLSYSPKYRWSNPPNGKPISQPSWMQYRIMLDNGHDASWAYWISKAVLLTLRDIWNTMSSQFSRTLNLKLFTGKT